ncbi:unnamed protein product [Rotaria sp. Silwood2]|nr:unnamed protein product [Rotaria sp. Silwood2]CAF4471681.1 unnamed protein product [Rotaria sp. Silwood2]
MNGPSTVNHSTQNNEQLIGKFHVVNVDKLATNPINNHDETTTIVGQTPIPPPAASSSSTTTTTTDESVCPSRFQMIRVDRNFVRGRWKVNDYEPPENIATINNPPVMNSIENEPVNNSNTSTIPTSAPITTIQSNIPQNIPADSNATSSATLAATAAGAAAAAATAFQHQQQRLAMNNAATVVPTANVPPPAGLLSAYPPTALSNMGAPNQAYILPSHPQFGYYQILLPPYSPYAAQWAALAATNSFLPPTMPPPQQQTSQLPTGNLGEPIRLTDAVTDGTSENPVISSNLFPNPTTDHLQNAQMAAASTPQFIYAAQLPHSTYVSQAPPNAASPYATIPAYHSAAQPSTIIPSTVRPTSLAQLIPNNITDIQQQQQQQQQQHQQPQIYFHQVLPIQHHQHQQQQQQAPTLTSPKHDTASTKTSIQPPNIPKATTTATTTLPAKLLTTNANGTNTDILKTTIAQINQTKPVTIISNNANTDTLKTITATNPTYITDLLSTSPSLPNVQQQSRAFMSPITIQTNNPSNMNSPNKAPTASLNDIWSYTTSGPPLNLTQTAAQTAAVTAVAAMGLLNSENSQNTEIANEILKELTTPTKQNNTTDIDIKISAAMDLVKMHLLSAVRDEVTELRQQIRTLNDKVNSVEHENAFLRQHVSSEIYAQFIPLFVGVSSANDLSNPTTTVTTTASSMPSSSIMSSQSMPMAFVSSFPPSFAQQPPLSTTLQPLPPLQQPPSSTNLPST